jgi:hypothetical protein
VISKALLGEAFLQRKKRFRKEAFFKRGIYVRYCLCSKALIFNVWGGDPKKQIRSEKKERGEKTERYEAGFIYGGTREE